MTHINFSFLNGNVYKKSNMYVMVARRIVNNLPKI